MRDLMFVGAWLVFIPLACWAGAAAGVLLWAWTSLLAPNDVLYGFGAGFPFAKIAAGLTFVLLLARGDGLRFRLGRAELLMLGLAAVSLVSQSMTAAADAAPGWDICEKYLKVLLLAVIVTGVMTTRLRLQALVLAICLGMGFTGVAEGLKFLLSGGAHKTLGSPSLGDNNHVALNILLIIPLLQHLHVVLRQRAARLVVAASALLCVVGVIATYSRGGFAGLLIIGFATVLASRRKVVGLAGIVVAGLVFSQLVGADWIARMQTVESTQSVESDDSFMGRVAAWKVSTAVALHRPFGSGFHGIQHGEVWWAYAGEAAGLPLFPATDPDISARAAHSIYFEILGDLGFVGLGLFVLLFVGALLSARRVRARLRAVRRRAESADRDRADPDWPDLDWAADLAARLQTSLLVFMLCGGLLSASYFDIDYLLVALVVALRRHVVASLPDAAIRRGVGRPVPARGVTRPAGSAALAPAYDRVARGER